jgi:hypothetical protein
MIDFRTRLHSLMVETLADEKAHHNWVYRAVRPMPVPVAWHMGQKVYGDCSKGVEYLCKWAGVKTDPMGMAYGPYGNSATLCAHLQHLDNPSQLFIGDIVTFGSYGDEHAAMVMERGPDPVLWSFGHQGAPNTYRLSQDHRSHQLLCNPLPDYIPTAIERLREKTGYFAWVAWRLGEGDWIHYGAANPHARPKVPTVIPPAWWARYRHFIHNRHGANEIGTKNINFAL